VTDQQATFEIDSRSDSYAARRVLEQVYDTIREESRTVRAGSDDATELLAAFQAVRDVVDHRRGGTLTITYEQAADAPEFGP
jgi:hypothetical protein